MPSPVLGCSTCVHARGGGDAVPVVAHRHHLAGAPGRVLVGVVRAAGMAGRAGEHRPAAVLPVADVEHVAAQRAIGAGRPGGRAPWPTAITVSPSPPTGRDGGSSSAAASGIEAESGWLEARLVRLAPGPRRRSGRRPRPAPPPSTSRPGPAVQHRGVVAAQQAPAASTRAARPATRPAVPRRTDAPRPPPARCGAPGSPSSPGAARCSGAPRPTRPSIRPSQPSSDRAQRRLRPGRPAPAPPAAAPGTARHAATACRRAASPRPRPGTAARSSISSAIRAAR